MIAAAEKKQAIPPKERKRKSYHPSNSSGAFSGKREEKSSEKAIQKTVLLIDASVASAAIKFPTNLTLLHVSWTHSEPVIDKLHVPGPGKARPYAGRCNAHHRPFIQRNMRRTIHKALPKRWEYETRLRNLFESELVGRKCDYDWSSATIKTIRVRGAWIAAAFFAMNLACRLQDYLLSLFSGFFSSSFRVHSAFKKQIMAIEKGRLGLI
jgi:hypothetical protein